MASNMSCSVDVTVKIFSSTKELIHKFNSIISLPGNTKELFNKLKTLYEDSTHRLEVGKTQCSLTVRQMSKKKTYSILSTDNDETFDLLKGKICENSSDFDLVCKYIASN